ncbi:RAVE protein 1 C terminal-domain-containing protein [Ilyonectria robusta]|uniref:RAVE protein 1 C terminal-domain-containing protein n=1 Tax=Ilyonectria robusta TaxID=1079257 RepID=UPI001E8DAEF3|nr:RAVE protein 1 C terminal-domain-containing protein [Ilyonectria robusta]KAH8694846.1 RAVE protein 1 C terminal-domain-containing protein [Ilyonectria robusta]
MSLDRLPSDADHLVAHMQPQIHRPPSPSDDDDDHSSNASRAPSSQDPYYSNDDIATLHAVAAAAQKLLDSSPEPKPLPVAALFKAYDVVLPSYGIDPDTDHHLSALLFRISGEKGDGSLVDKFQAILSRMGIVLEFGDHTSGSSRASPHTSPAFSSSSPQAYARRRREADDQMTDEIDFPNPPIVPATTSPREADTSSHPISAENEVARQAALSAVMARWRGLALRRRERQAQEEASSKITTEKAPQVSDVGKPLSQDHLDQEDRDMPTSGTREEEPEPEPEPQTSIKPAILGQSSHHDSLRSLLDPARLPGISLEGLPIDQAQGAEGAEWPLQSEEGVPQVEQAHLVEHPENRVIQGIFPPVISHGQEDVPPRIALEADATGENEEQDLTQRPFTPTEQPNVSPPHHTPTQTRKEANTAELEARHQKLMRQASRARELYLASKVFNHWADRTARRLERDAVARRHMIRFRCFRTWSQAPAFREPTANHMRSAYTVKKWQRIAMQNENLERIAKEAAEAYRLKTMQRVLNQWSYHRLQRVGRDITALRSKTKAVSTWMSLVSATLVLSEATTTQSRHRYELSALTKWQGHTDQELKRAAASRRIGIVQQSFTYLQEWWDQTEIRRRAAAYRQYLLIKRACFAFDQWNLQARAQAFIWRREYVSVTRVFETWCSSLVQTEELQRKAISYYRNRTQSKVLRCMRHLHEESSQLSHLESRARLYIRGTRLLSVFNKAIQQRRDQDKEHVKRYLMARYTEMSSTRKKRNFFAALDKWRAFTLQDQGHTRIASELKARNQSQRQMASLQLWNERAEVEGKHLREAQLHHVQGWLEVWRDHAGDLEQRDMEAWQLWAVERQRNCLKEWSISSLQQSGQAHTASEVHKKHNRERRNRYLQLWRQIGDRPRSHITGVDSQRVSTTHPPGSYRGSWIALSGRRSVIRRNDKGQDFSTSLVETPTRWTGQPIIMSGILPETLMAPVREADEDDGASSTTGDDLGMMTSPSKRPQDRRADRFSSLSSTTPRAPVPLHLEHDFQEQSSEPESIPSTSFLRPSASIKPVGYRPMNERLLGSQPSSQSLSRGVASKSVGGRPSGLRHGVSQSSRLTPPTSSVRFQSPKSFSVTTQLRGFGLSNRATLAGKNARSVIFFGSMKAVLPGKPQSRLQGLASGYWDARHINAYITGSAFAILDGSYGVLQTIYDDDPQPLEAIAFDEASGKIATCTATQVRVYRPFGSREDALKWALESTFDIPHPNPESTCALSWGGSEELLVATSSLSLYGTKAEPKCIWQKKLPSPVKYASLSYDSAYIASAGQHDRLVKVWRRLTYGSDEVRFDLTYLRHPAVVTSARWRKPFHIEQTADNVLYTICLDKCVRVWIPTESPDGKHWQLWGQVDICAPSRDYPNPQDMRWAFIIDGRDFTASVEKAVEDRMSDDPSTDEVALDHLVAIANKNPEICIALDGRGMMSAWALENVSSSSAGTPTIFNVAQVKSPHFELLGQFLASQKTPHTEVQTYCDRKSGKVHILLHSFDGRIGVFTGSVADLFDPTTNDRRLALHAVWSGHSSSITKIVRNFSGRAVVSRTRDGESIVWKHVLNPRKNPGLGLSRASVIPEKRHIHRICVLRKGRFVVFLCQDTISLWDCRSAQARSIAECDYQALGKPLCLILLPRRQVKEYTVAHIATVTSERQGIVWEIKLPRYFDDPNTTTGANIKEFCRFELEDAEGLAYVLPVDPAGSSPVVSGFLDIFARDVAISYSQTGRVDFWTARVDPEQNKVGWLSTCSTETGLSEPALVSGSTLKKAALVNSTRSQLTIWDGGSSRLEYENDFKTHNMIRDLDWTSTPDSQSILAVGFQYRVILLSQMRFDYLNKGPAWAQIREISIRELTPHPIGDSTWLGDGHLVIGAGNQMFVQDRQVGVAESHRADLRLPPRKDGAWDIFEAVQRFNGPLPVFHPQFLSQCILSGKTILVRRTLVALHKILKYHIQGETIDNYLGMDEGEFYDPMQSHTRAIEKASGSYLSGSEDDGEDDDIFTEQTAVAINDKLTKLGIPQLSGHEQIQLADIIECVSLVERHRRSMDENGARFMLFFRQHALRKGRTNEMHLSWREINWAYHSNSQDILVDFVSRQNHGTMLWEHARESGLFMWLSDAAALKTQFELIARNEYTKSDVKNPVNCSLYYLALRKKTVLQGLWRMANWNKEQGATQRLLSNNFDDPKWKTTALKNAYALLSKRRFEYAAAFFLLADHLHDAVEVCLKQLKDMQLAIAIARVYEGDNGPVLRRLLQDEVLPLAAQEGNRWLASWAFWLLGRKDMAVRALIMPVYTLLETPCSPDIKSRLFLTDDPALVVLYSHLRHQTLQTLRGASKVTPKVEWEFVLHSAKLYDRMGCDLLGLDLVRNWEFQQPGLPGFGGEVNPLKLLRRRTSLVVADLPTPSLQFETQTSGKKTSQAPPTTFQEPDASSLLDSFGF